jgi:hypothetical protein
MPDINRYLLTKPYEKEQMKVLYMFEEVNLFSNIKINATHTPVSQHGEFINNHSKFFETI